MGGGVSILSRVHGTSEHEITSPCVGETFWLFFLVEDGDINSYEDVSPFCRICLVLLPESIGSNMLHCSYKIEFFDERWLFDRREVAPDLEECIGLGLGPPHADFFMFACPLTKHFSLAKFITGPS